jgi:heme oxygenase (biliverdin-IX-beta and delta-forming)
MARSEVLQYLRSETQLYHDRIERAVDLPTRLGSLPSYRELLIRFYGFYAPLEPQLLSIPGSDASGLDLPLRCKSAMLRDDLKVLGLTAVEMEAIPLCDVLPAVDDLPSLLGCLYVLEGATLGGQFIRKDVRRRFGLDSSNGCCFFSSYGERVGEMWSKFCSAVTGYDEQNPGSHRPIGLAAIETFVRLEHWVEGKKAC